MKNVLDELFSNLLGCLTGDDYDLRREALVALSKLRGQMAAEIIFERYQLNNLDDFLTAAIAKLSPEKYSHVLVAALNDSHIEARVRAAEALSHEKSDVCKNALTDAVERYLNAGKDNAKSAELLSEDALQCAIRALGGIGDPMCVSLLRKILLRDRNHRIRASAVAALGPWINDSMLSFFSTLLKDVDPRVRANAIEALALLDDRKVVGLLQPYLYDSHQRVRANAAKAIWKFGDFEVTSVIREMLGHEEKRQKISGIYALGEVRIETFHRNLLNFLKDPDPDVRRNSVVALRKYGKSENLPVLLPLLSDPVVEVRVQVVLAIAELGRENWMPHLLEHFGREEVPFVRATIVSQIGKFGGESQAEQLAIGLEDRDQGVVSAAIEAIGKLKASSPSAGMVLTIRRFLKSENPKVKAESIRVLWNWGCEEVLESILEFLQVPDKSQKKAGLQCLGEIFHLSSAEDGEKRGQFEKMLEAAVARRRQEMAQESSTAVQGRIKELFDSSLQAIKENQLEKAKEHLKVLLSIAPKQQHALVLLGEIQVREKSFDEAESSFLQALAIDPNLVKAHFALGQIYHGRKLWKRTIESLKTVIRLYPKIPQAYLLLADSQEWEHQYVDSMVTYKRLQALIPKNSQVMQKFAKVAFLAGRVGESIPIAKAAAELGKLEPTSEFILAFSEYLAGNSERACPAFLGIFSSLLETPVNRTTLDLRRMLKVALEVVAKRLAESKPA